FLARASSALYLRSFPTRRSSDLGGAVHLAEDADWRGAARFFGQVRERIGNSRVGGLGIVHDERFLTDFGDFDDLERAVVGPRNQIEEHTSELQSHLNIVCRLLLE